MEKMFLRRAQKNASEAGERWPCPVHDGAERQDISHSRRHGQPRIIILVLRV